MHLLDELGLLPYILAQPHSLLTEGLVRLNGTNIGGFQFTTIVPEYPYAIWMPQPIFLRALVHKAAPFPSFQCWMGARVSGLIEDNGTVVGVQGLRDGQEPFEVCADVVVGADGRYSRLRRLGHFEVEYAHHDLDIIWFVVERPPDWPNTIYVSLGQDVRGLILPKYPQHLQAGIVLPADAWRHWRDDGVTAVADRVRRFDPAFTAFADSLHDFTPFFPLEGRILLVQDWARDGMVLIGDAAHTMSPAGAIGVNVALATAAVAAQVLYPLLGHGPIAHEDLHTIQQLREGDVRTLHRFQLGAQRVLLGPVGSDPSSAGSCRRCYTAAAFPSPPPDTAPAVFRGAAATIGSGVSFPGRRRRRGRKHMKCGPTWLLLTPPADRAVTRPPEAGCARRTTASGTARHRQWHPDTRRHR